MEKIPAIGIIIIIALLVGGGILLYQYWWVPRQENLQEKTEEPIQKITVLSPNGAEIWEYNKTYEIRWEKGKNLNEAVTIFLNNDKIWSNPLVIQSSASNTGSFGWTVPKSLNDSSGAAVNIDNDSNYKILVQGNSSQDSDFSDATFSIAGIATSSAGTPGTPSCSMKWWFDSNTKVCGYSQFCGAYMYYGLQTFDNESDCLTHLPYTPACSMKWWFDSSNTTCGYKQFCGLYMYYGLQTFNTQSECQTHSPSGY